MAYRASSRTARDTQRNIVMRKQKKGNKRAEVLRCGYMQKKNNSMQNDISEKEIWGHIRS